MAEPEVVDVDLSSVDWRSSFTSPQPGAQAPRPRMSPEEMATIQARVAGGAAARQTWLRSFRAVVVPILRELGTGDPALLMLRVNEALERAGLLGAGGRESRIGIMRLRQILAEPVDPAPEEDAWLAAASTVEPVSAPERVDGPGAHAAGARARRAPLVAAAWSRLQLRAHLRYPLQGPEMDQEALEDRRKVTDQVNVQLRADELPTVSESTLERDLASQGLRFTTPEPSYPVTTLGADDVAGAFEAPRDPLREAIREG